MTVTITEQHLYIGVVVFFMVMQILQWAAIRKLQRECDRLWEQLGTIVAAVSSQLIGMQKDLNSKEDKKAG